MQTRDDFVARRKQRWDELDRLLASNAPLHRRDPHVISRVATLYRAVCSDLMRAHALGFTHDLVDHLNSLAGRSHNALYGSKPFSVDGVRRFLTVGFPRTLRKCWRPMLAATLLFYVPLLLGLVATVADQRFALHVLPPTTLQSMVESYSTGFSSGRETGADSAMAGFYVYNNVSIAFRCFATGILFGLGSLFFIVYNGLVIGTVLGYVTAAGHGLNILTFICSHSPFELTAIVIAGGAGLKMGYALVETGGRTRLGSLKAQMGALAGLVMGAAVLLLIAAIIEGFWSPSSLPPPVKWVFSAFACGALVLYFWLAGRARSEPTTSRSGHAA